MPREKADEDPPEPQRQQRPPAVQPRHKRLAGAQPKGVAPKDAAAVAVAAAPRRVRKSAN